jgi:hypothetical protein
VPTVQGMTLACIRVDVIAIRCQAEGAAVANHKSRGPRGGGVAPTAFRWAHASRDNSGTEFSRTAAWPGGGHGAGGRRTLAASSGATHFCGRLLERISIQDLQGIRVNKPRNTAFA